MELTSRERDLILLGLYELTITYGDDDQLWSEANALAVKLEDVSSAGNLSGRPNEQPGQAGSRSRPKDAADRTSAEHHAP